MKRRSKRRGEQGVEATFLSCLRRFEAVRFLYSRPMIDRLRERNPGYPLAHLLFYEIGRAALSVPAALLYDLRAEGQNRIPRRGGVILAANHQSHLDPPLMGLHCRRHLHYMAKVPLFTNPLFARLIRAMNAIPLDQDKEDFTAIRATIEHLRLGRAVLIYPEGSRTPDGAVHEFKAGVALLIRRAKVPVVPVAIEGSFDAWPRDRVLPRPCGRLMVMYGETIGPDELRGAGRGALEMLRARIEALHREARRRLTKLRHGSTA